MNNPQSSQAKIMEKVKNSFQRLTVPAKKGIYPAEIILEGQALLDYAQMLHMCIWQEATIEKQREALDAISGMCSKGIYEEAEQVADEALEPIPFPLKDD